MSSTGILQVVNGEGDFNEEGVNEFVKRHNINDVGVGYQVVAITGPQSSGKSTLMNAVVRLPSYPYDLTLHVCLVYLGTFCNIPFMISVSICVQLESCIDIFSSMNFRNHPFIPGCLLTQQKTSQDNSMYIIVASGFHTQHGCPILPVFHCSLALLLRRWMP
jgi:hypothetical protein